VAIKFNKVWYAGLLNFKLLVFGRMQGFKFYVFYSLSTVYTY